MNTINWQTIAHAVVGMLIAGSQATAMGFATNVNLVTICHIVAIVVAQAGVSLGVWTVTSSVATKRALMAANCTNCGKPAFADNVPAVPVGVPVVEEKK